MKQEDTREFLKMKMAIAHLLTIDLTRGEKVEVYMNFATFRHFRTGVKVYKGRFIESGKGCLVKTLCQN